MRLHHPEGARTWGVTEVHIGEQGEDWTNLGKRISVLEGFGAAQCVTLWAKDIVKIGAAAITVDNAGFLGASTNGSSRCEYEYTMSKFIQDMSVHGGEYQAFPHRQEDNCRCEDL